jgi:hypothetical protein
MEKRSDIGDRYTWMEAEAEKLLKFASPFIGPKIHDILH